MDADLSSQFSPFPPVQFTRGLVQVAYSAVQNPLSFRMILPSHDSASPFSTPFLAFLLLPFRVELSFALVRL